MVRYIHNNQVEEGLVIYPEDYVYSIAGDYSRAKVILEGVVVLQYCHTKGFVRQRGVSQEITQTLFQKIVY